METLDTSCPQVLIDFFNDENGFLWHSRLLLVSDGSGHWIGATPDGGIELIDLTQHRVRPLERKSPYPDDIQDQIYTFDEQDEASIAELARRSHALARVLGFGKQTEPDDDGSWRLSDVGHGSFGEAVPEQAVGEPASFVARGRCALVLLDDEWTVAEYVPHRKEAEWRHEKGAGAGRDFRVLPLVKGGQGRRFISMEDAMALYRDEVQKEWPFSGPRVVVEYMKSLRDGGLNFKTHHFEWLQKSGVHSGGAVARQHLTLCTALRFMQSFDQVDLSMCATAEYLTRGLVQLEAAARRNPKSPDFTGLEVILEAYLDASGSAMIAKFDEWVMEQQRSKAQIAKQGRLLREEADHEKKRAEGRAGEGAGRGGGQPSDQ